MSAFWRLTLCGGVLVGMAVAFYGTLPGGVFGIASLVCMAAGGIAGSRALGPRVRELREARQRRLERGAEGERVLRDARRPG